MDLPEMSRWAAAKGIGLLGTGDVIHPSWIRSLERRLRPTQEEGIYLYRGTRFLLTGEISCIWRQDGRGRRIHLLYLVPSLAQAKKIQRELGRLGNIASDGRPILGTSARRAAEAIWEASEKTLIVPAHIWTPWYSLFGSKSGFDRLETCLGEHAGRIAAVETGLSSDPAMNRRVAALDGLSLLSFSDAHSPSRLGREATIFDVPELSFSALDRAIRGRGGCVETIELYPEEGKYFYDGHRGCGVALSPREARARAGRCPVCGKPLTLGVLHRVEDLADRAEPAGLPCSRHIVPLVEVIAQALGQRSGTKRVQSAYAELIRGVGDEYSILFDRSFNEIERVAGTGVAKAIVRVRRGSVVIEPGYDGVYGKVRIPLSD